MPNSFQGINTMSSALRAMQTQLDVTGENIANSETVGYHRRTVTLSQNPSTNITIGKTVSIGNGVSVSGVTRVRDMFLAGRRTEAESRMGRQQEALTGLSKIQGAMLEPGDQGVSAAYDAFNNAWSALSASPGSLAAKADVQAAGAKLATKVQNFGKELQSQRADNLANTKDILGKIDASTKKIVELNDRIGEATARGAVPNDLLDQRDMAMQDLSGLADVSFTTSNGNVSASLNGYRLIDPSGAKPVAANYDFATGRIVEGTTSFSVYGGSLAGAFDAKQAITATQGRLDAFADGIRSSVNALFANGKTADGTTGAPFFAEPVLPDTATTALNLRLADPIAADPNAIASGTSGLSGDGTLAAQISGLRDAKVASLGNVTLGGYYADLVSDVGGRTAAAQDAVDTQDSVIKQIDAQISGTDGVSMDDEMANLLRFQRAYQAAAKALSTFDAMSETIINMLNR